VEDLLTAPDGNLADLDAPVGDDQEALTGFTLFEEGLSAAEASYRAPAGR
jgi:hypothetical protein